MNVKTISEKEKQVSQAIIIADTFTNEFIPFTHNIPHALLPLLNKPLIDYTLEFLAWGEIEEVFLYCTKHVDAIKAHIEKCIKNYDGWTLHLRVNVIVAELCQSLGDCLRDLDAKGLIRGDFVLLEPGVLSNIKLLPILKKHAEKAKSDKYAAMTIVYQKVGPGFAQTSSEKDFILVANHENRILFYKELGMDKPKAIKFPKAIFLDNPSTTIYHNLKDTHIAICSASVLPLFSDNFDFQTKSDFIKGLLTNEEISEGTMYTHFLTGGEIGGAVSSWRRYQGISTELLKNFILPITHPKTNTVKKDGVVVGACTSLPDNSKLLKSVIGCNVILGNNVVIENSFIFSDTKIGNNVCINYCVIGSNCKISGNCKLSTACIIGNNVVLEKGTNLDNAIIQSTDSDDHDTVKLGDKAYQLKISDEDDIYLKYNKLRLYIKGHESEKIDEEIEGFSESEEELSHTHSPPPDDTKLFYTEVIDSLTRGFDDNLCCDNLILEINSSRYAYNVTLKEVNFSVVKAILTMSLREPIGVQYLNHVLRLLNYFGPVLKNYISNKSAMRDALQAVEDVATTNENIKDKWAIMILKHMYEKDYISEEVILDWCGSLDNRKFISDIKPFTDWLREAEEESDDE